MAIFGGWRLTRTGIVFILGIVLLGGLVTGGIFLVKNRGEAVRRDAAIKLAEQNLRDQSKVAAQPIASEEKEDETSGAASGATTETKNDAATHPAELPATGMSDLQVLQGSVMLAVLALSVTYYVASRRAVEHL